jgi:hypothetical protein
LLAEYGVSIPIGISHITKDVPKIVEDDGHDLPREVLINSVSGAV